MTILELRTKVHKFVDEAPEEKLLRVLDYIEQNKDLSPEQIRRDSNFKKILTEDKNLLKRLAE